MVAALFGVVAAGGGIVGVMAAHVGSRAVYFLTASWFGRASFRLSVAGVSWAELVWSVRACRAIGIAGLMVMLYDPLDILLLSHYGKIADLAIYSAAQRLSWPVLMALSAVGGTLYSVLATAWPDDRARFGRLCQRGLDVVLVLGGAAVAALMAGAEFLLGILGPTLVDGAEVLRVMSVLALVKAVSMTLGPALLIMKAQHLILGMIGGALVTKLIVMSWVVPRFGAIGVAWSAVAIDSILLVLPVLVATSRQVGLWLHPGIVLKVVVFCAVSVLAARWVFVGHAVLPLIAAPAFYIALAWGGGALRISDWRGLRSPAVVVEARQ
jgi:O-antigen/teichoic acid export membrane protein